MEQRVLLQVEDGIALVELNRAEKRNALDMPMFYGLRDTIKKLRKMKALRGVLLTSKGEDFCSGLDIKSVLRSPRNGFRLLWKWWPGRPNLAQFVSVGFRQLPIPVVCAIQGRCWGGGMQIALGADFRIASPEASLSILEGKWGLVPDMGGTLALRELMPVDKAMYLAMSANEITAEEALAMQLVTELHEDPNARGKALLEELCRRSPDSIAAVKKLYHKAWHHNDGGMLARETWYQLRILTGKNQKIAVKRETTQKDLSYTPRKRW